MNRESRLRQRWAGHGVTARKVSRDDDNHKMVPNSIGLAQTRFGASPTRFRHVWARPVGNWEPESGTSAACRSNVSYLALLCKRAGSSKSVLRQLNQISDNLGSPDPYNPHFSFSEPTGTERTRGRRREIWGCGVSQPPAWCRGCGAWSGCQNKSAFGLPRLMFSETAVKHTKLNVCM